MASLLAGPVVLAAEDVSVNSTNVSKEDLSDELVKVTWQAELENTTDKEIEVSVQIDLYSEDGSTLETFTIDSFVIPAKSAKKAVQSRPLSGALWKKVDSHDVSVSDP